MRTAQGRSSVLRHRILIVGAIAVLTILLACRPEPSPSPSRTEIPPTVQLAPTESPASPAQDPAAAPGISSPTLAATSPTAMPALSTTPSAVVLVRPSPTTVPPTPTETPSTPATLTPVREAAEDVAEIRRIIAEYWESLNDYDVDHAITMLEPAYRADEEELIRKDIGQMEMFRVKLDVSEKTPPEINNDGDYEARLSIGTPIDTRTVLMVFRRIDEQWWIVFSDEVEE